MQTWTLEPFEFHDKMLLKKRYRDLACGLFRMRLPVMVPISPGMLVNAIDVNIGAYVDEGTMVDTWATVGSCAQIGKGVHLSGALELVCTGAVAASPVIIEDGCFIGSRCIVVEGVIVEKEAVLGANVVLTQSTKIIDEAQ